MPEARFFLLLSHGYSAFVLTFTIIVLTFTMRRYVKKDAILLVSKEAEGRQARRRANRRRRFKITDFSNQSKNS